jgi:glycosyltransferase involved in cell wall biosynthesis
VDPKILAVTPARNEERYLPKLFESLTKQTIRPNLWMIIDDGSVDSTPKLANEYADLHEWVHVRVRKDRGRYFRGKGVAETFAYGVSEASAIFPDWDILAKIDADTELPENYFAAISRKFLENPKLGIASGINFGEEGIASHPRGNNRLYRRECWDSIGGLPPISGWDTWDEVTARAKGWQTVAFGDIAARHLRPEANTVRYSFQQGKISRFLGYSWFFALARSLKMSYLRNPFCGLGYLFGYLSENQRIQDPEFVRSLRVEQKSRVKSVLRPSNNPAS